MLPGVPSAGGAGRGLVGRSGAVMASRGGGRGRLAREAVRNELGNTMDSTDVGQHTMGWPPLKEQIWSIPGVKILAPPHVGFQKWHPAGPGYLLHDGGILVGRLPRRPGAVLLAFADARGLGGHVEARAACKHRKNQHGRLDEEVTDAARCLLSPFERILASRCPRWVPGHPCAPSAIPECLFVELKVQERKHTQPRNYSLFISRYVICSKDGFRRGSEYCSNRIRFLVVSSRGRRLEDAAEAHPSRHSRRRQ